MQGLLPDQGHGDDGKDVCSVLMTSDLQIPGNAYTRGNICPVKTVQLYIGTEFLSGSISKR